MAMVTGERSALASFAVKDLSSAEKGVMQVTQEHTLWCAEDRSRQLPFPYTTCISVMAVWSQTYRLYYCILVKQQKLELSPFYFLAAKKCPF